MSYAYSQGQPSPRHHVLEGIVKCEILTVYIGYPDTAESVVSVGLAWGKGEEIEMLVYIAKPNQQSSERVKSVGRI